MRIITRVLATLYIVYLAIAVLVLLPALNFVPAWYIKQTFNRDFYSEIIVFNPFTLALEVRQAQLPEQNGERFAGLDVAAVNLSLESLWQPGWVLDAVKVKGLYLHVRQLSRDSFNFSDLLSEDEPDTAPTAQRQLPSLTIHELDLQSDVIRFSDESRDKHYSTHWDGLAISVQDLSTVLEEGQPYRIDVRGEAGGRLHWEGEVSVPAARSEGRLEISNLSLHSFWRFAEPWVQFELQEGTLGVAGRYRLDWGDSFSYQVEDGRIQLAAIDLHPKAAAQLPDTALSLRSINIAGIAVDGPARHASIDSITVEGLAVAGWSEGTRVSVAELFATAAEPEAAGETTVDPGEDQAREGWTAAIGSARMQTSSLRWRSEFTDPPVLQLTPIDVAIDDINWPLSGDSRLSLNLTANNQARIGIEGVLALAGGNGSLSYKLDGLPLPWFNPNLPAALKARLTGGMVQVDGQVALTGYAPTTVQLDGAITDFSGAVEEAETALTSWDTLRWKGLSIDLEQRKVSLQGLDIHNYAGRVHIHKDGSINAQNVWQAEVGEQAEELAEDLSLDQPWQVNVPAIRITDSAIDFMDESLAIPFRTAIEGLEGEVLGLTSAPGTVTHVNLTGSVDGYAPLALRGTVEPFASLPGLDLKLTFDGIDLSRLTPYSGTYTGKAIDGGLLDLHLAYTLQDNRLKGNNELRIDQLKLGNKIESDKALNVPLELALALLTDSRGVIDMQIPVSGNVNEPGFDLGSVIVDAFINLITSAVTAPFSLLAKLVGSERDLQRLALAPGSAQLDESNQAKLTQLGSALAQRPALTLVINGRLNSGTDRERLQKNALQEQLLAAGLPPEELKSRGPAFEQAINQRYRSLPRSSAEDAVLTAREEYIAVAQTIRISDAQLLELAEQRALAVKNYLVTQAQLDPDRAVIDKHGLDDKAHIFSGVELDVGT